VSLRDSVGERCRASVVDSRPAAGGVTGLRIQPRGWLEICGRRLAVAVLALIR
jgi:hypothetical protein